MKVTKEQKVYLGLLAVGLVAFGLDRTVFSPASADAADASSDLLVNQDAKPAHTAAAAPKAGAQSAVNPLVGRLAKLSESLHLPSAEAKDVFHPSATWSGVAADGAVADTQAFEQKHHLNGVMLGRRPAAMVDADLVAVGQVLDGYRLVSVTHGAAIFQRGDMSVTLRGR